MPTRRVGTMRYIRRLMKTTSDTAHVIGAGLAGSEAAWQLAARGIPVVLHETKPAKMSPAHRSPLFAELVCSNSLRSDRLQNAVGLLKEEMRRLGSLVLTSADAARVPAGGALAVDRDAFSSFITHSLKNHPLITVVEGEVTQFPDAPAIIATGPLTSEALSEAILAQEGMGLLNFYDAAAPIVTKDSLDMRRVFRASRYERGDDYLNCPLNREEYERFMAALLGTETAEVHGFEDSKVFEGCMPVESMAKRGHMALAFGPMKPVGLVDPNTGEMPFAVVQLRRDDAGDTLYNLVGFQTRLRFHEQRRVFGLIPGLENAEFARYGVMHRNTFLNSPGVLDNLFQMRQRQGVYFAGQITGVEGYVESAASGLTAGIALSRQMKGEAPVYFPPVTAIGALGDYVSRYNRHFQPMNVTFGLMEPLKERVRGKEQRYLRLADRALEQIDALLPQLK